MPEPTQFARSDQKLFGGYVPYLDGSGGGLLTLDGGRVVEQFHYARPGRGCFWACDFYEAVILKRCIERGDFTWPKILSA